MAELCGAYPSIYRKPPPILQSCMRGLMYLESRLLGHRMSNPVLSQSFGCPHTKKWVQDFNISVIEEFLLLLL